MAITKMRHIKGAGGSSALKRSIAYIMDPVKTEDGLFVGGNAGTTPGEAFRAMMETKWKWWKADGRQGYHFVISWRPGEAAKDLAFQIAGEFCSRYLGDDYDYVYTLHTDRDHLHAHIVFNSVNRRTGYKYHYKKGDWERSVQPVTDAVCREHGLSALSAERTGKRGLSYAEHTAVKEGRPTLTKIVCADIDLMIRQSADLEDFFSKMEALGYRIRRGKYITYCPPGFSRGRRDKNLGEGYSRSAIAYRIAHKEKEGYQTPRVLGEDAAWRMETVLGPYLKAKLSPCQLLYVKRIRSVSSYLEARNPFALKWRYVRKDAIEIDRLFEECMYLLDKEIPSAAALSERYPLVGRREKNLIRRILNRERDEKDIFPDRTSPGMRL